MDYNQAMDYLHELEKLGFILGLEPIKELMEVLGRPDKSLRYIHIGGTNGKGSMATYLDRILREAGYKTGLYTSPAILSYGERVRVSGENVTEEKIGGYLTRIREASEENEIQITAFEAETAMAILHFAEEEVDFAILEVGLGGSNDATNFIGPAELTVLTRIGLDHTDFLGDTVEEVAGEKAGIIKSGSRVVSYFQEDGVREVFESKAQEVGADLKFLKEENVVLEDRSLEGQYFSYGDWKNIKISMLGTYQIFNAALALMAVEELRDLGWEINDDAIREGFDEAIIPGRFQLISQNPPIIVDGGHNPQGAQALVDSLKEFFGDRKHRFVFGTLRDKDYIQAIKITMEVAEKYYTLMPKTPRALSSLDLRNQIQNLGVDAQALGSARMAISTALAERQEGEAIVVFGSLYQLAEVYDYLWELKEEAKRTEPADEKNVVEEIQSLEVGEVLANEDLKNHTTFKIGGPCKALVIPDSYQALIRLQKFLKENGEDYFIIGNGSNLLVKDTGLNKIVIKIDENLSDVRVEGNKIIAQAGATLAKVSKIAIREGLAGMEGLSGIPGNIGGAVYMNAGAYGTEIKDVLESVKVINDDGEVEKISLEDLDLSYRHSKIQDLGLTVLEATFALEKGDPEEIRAIFSDLTKKRTSRQPLDKPSAGSTFKRPEGDYAARLIDEAGLRGFRIGNAMVSDKHTGFIVTDGPSSYEEVRAVIEHVRKTVEEKYGICLETEVKIIGD